MQRKLITLMLVLLGAQIAFVPAASAQQVFAVIGDFGDGSSSEAAVANMVHSWDPDFIITTGDNNLGTLSGPGQQWTAYVGNFYGQYTLGDTSGGSNRYPEQTGTTQRFFPSVGNHDTPTSSGTTAHYLDYFHDEVSGPGRLPTGTGSHSSAASYYDFVVGDAHFFAVDSDHIDPTTMAAQKAWLQAGLEGSTSKFDFVYFHHAAYSSCSSHSSTEQMQWPFQQWGATAVFGGHDHVYERIILTDDDHDAFPYFTVGFSGRSLYGFATPIEGSVVRYSSDYGALRVTLDGDQAIFDAFSIAGGGAQVDTYSLLIPEPTTLALLSTGAVMLLRRRRPGGMR